MPSSLAAYVTDQVPADKTRLDSLLAQRLRKFFGRTDIRRTPQADVTF
jgi:hypothetical protein